MRPDATAWDIPPVTTGTRPRSRFTTVKTWYGHATRSYWAMVPWPAGEHGAVLLEAATEKALAAQIIRIRKQTR
ncbi:hypothetical protein BJF79_07325 [Actinomadura sp. CNU-125]|uniref:hypothetical protein n=1 Tax=Actinomadura sp. CNU-125 TaxID=1904961 RepID=UPI0009663D79|nr:hypothetical protein [Actinomadura sp. CNU-125]OLT34372.1 hypothetical protein BJF79_07325 [Actinomadura sp. CNU-125]